MSALSRLRVMALQACSHRERAVGFLNAEERALAAALDDEAISAVRELVAVSGHLALWMDDCQMRKRLRSALERMVSAQ